MCGCVCVRAYLMVQPMSDKGLELGLRISTFVCVCVCMAVCERVSES